ncbi:putative acetyltransferase [Streptomyces bingchenggensis BCW-1]|uniref:Putative acetyltransferase n=1 Tax=Streptomyces bingchenggensis (strain BCW-1) TaxID=749414 RepID=D7C1F0_STRBB|nr:MULTISPECIES: N-acetyltransferase [Streptomyces]ADI10015.1 putative acetyltransferase [Streptomyces bingchenggensis BCW-1]
MDLKHYGQEDVKDIRTMLLDIHDTVYEGLSGTFDSRERFAQFVDGWSSRDEWVCVIGFEEHEPVGYAYGAPFSPGGWWRGSKRPESLSPGERAFALSELMVMPRWRKTGTSLELHEALLSSRNEEAVTLFVDLAHPKVVTLYESWGYKKVDESKPYDDSPTFAVMLKRLKPLE